MAMRPGHAADPQDELEVVFLAIDVTSHSHNKYIALVVDRASRFPFGFVLSSKQADEVARNLAE